MKDAKLIISTSTGFTQAFDANSTFETPDILMWGTGAPVTWSMIYNYTYVGYSRYSIS